MTRPASAGRGAGPKHAPGAKRTPFVLLVLGLIVGGFCALLALNTVSAANELKRHDLAARDQSVANSIVGLQNDVAASAAPSNLARAADQLGMVPAGNPAFLVIGKDGSVTVMGSPAAASASAYVPPSDPRTSTSTSTAQTSTAKTSTAQTSTAQTSTAKTSTAKTSTAQTPTAKRTATSTPTTPSSTPTPQLTLPGGPR